MLDDKLLDVPELAGRLDKSSRTIREWCKKGYLPYIKLPSGTILFSWESVRAELQRRFGVGGDAT